MFRHLLLAAAFGALAACAQQPVYRQSTQPLATAHIDLDRYLGRWHEIARLPNAFERDCTGATAQYGRRDDGLVSVTNTCSASGRLRTAQGRAKPVGAAGEGKLKVSFFGPFWADYWVLDRADDYSWSIVGEPEGRYLWVLARAADLSAERRAYFETRVRALGFDPNDLIWAG